jgi:WD40 repeat protein
MPPPIPTPIYHLTHWQNFAEIIAMDGLLCCAALWDVATGKQLQVLQGHDSYISTVTYSPDGTLVASGSGDGTVRLWKVNTGEQLHRLLGHADALGTVAFSPDGRLLASGGKEPIPRLWDVASGKAIHQFALPAPGWFDCVAFSPDGKSLAANSPNNPAVIVWEVATRKERGRFLGRGGAGSEPSDVSHRALCSEEGR